MAGCVLRAWWGGWGRAGGGGRNLSGLSSLCVIENKLFVSVSPPFVYAHHAPRATVHHIKPMTIVPDFPSP